MKNKLKFTAKKLMLSTDKDVLVKLNNDFEVIENKINKLKMINTKGVKPLTHVNEDPIVLFREDIPGKVMKKETIISNAPSSQDGYITIDRVVK